MGEDGKGGEEKGREGEGGDGRRKGQTGRESTPSVTSSIRQCVLGMMIMFTSIMCLQANLELRMLNLSTT